MISRWAWAAPARVVLLQSATASPSARHCLRLIRDELAASGFDVSVVEGPPTGDPVTLANAMRAQRDTVATIGLLGDPEGAGAELWILDRLGERPEVRRLPVPTSERKRAGEVLAIRTVEVLRASALRFLVESKRAEPPTGAPTAPVAAVPPPAPAPSPSPAVTVRAAPPPPEAAPAARRRAFGVETGVSLLVSPGQLDPAAVPVVRIRASIAEPFLVRLTLAGLGTQPRLETSRGTASIAQTLGQGELGIAFRSERRLTPVLLLGGGVLHVATDARGVAPYVGQRDALWSVMVSAGAGVVATLSGRLALSLEAHVVLAAPHPVVRFADWEAATLARPALWTTLTLVSWL